MLVALALVLRAKPLLALRLSEKVLSAGQQYASQQRLPFLLWALSQASRCPPDSLRLRGMQATATHTYCFFLQGVFPGTQLWLQHCWHLVTECEALAYARQPRIGCCALAGRSQRWGWLCGSGQYCRRCWGSRWCSPPLTPRSRPQVSLSEIAPPPNYTLYHLCFSSHLHPVVPKHAHQRLLHGQTAFWGRVQ